MAVNLPPLPTLLPIPGIRCGAIAAGIRKPGRRDLCLFELPADAVTAALFTRNRFRAAPVQVAEAHLAAGMPRYLLVNTGNANAGTGEGGLRAAEASCEALAGILSVAPESVLPYSTGVIGEPLPVERITAGLPELVAVLDEDGWTDAAHGILTTDTAPKGISLAPTAERPFTLTGIAKGAGMIRPDMATMLAFIATDARVTPEVLRELLREAVDASFNRITVDGDTSTNDAVTLVATGAAAAPLVDRADSSQGRALAAGLTELCRSLAQAIVRDGEGATRFVTLSVAGARTSTEALAVAYTVAESPLVKTALFAGDPNWGRILAAIGRAGIEDLDVGLVSLHLGSVLIAEQGGVAASYREVDGARVMAEAEIEIRIDLGRGSVSETVWTTDLSYDYVKINAEYRS
jgi:glutamate N-acetyltransferase/amino-acid N-acetyltransferase